MITIVPLFLIFTFTLKMENFILDYLINIGSNNIGFNIVRMPFYCFNVPSKMLYGSIGAEFLRISRATSKNEDLSRNCKQLLSRMLKQNGQMRTFKFSLIKMTQRHQDVFIKYNKSIEEVMQAMGF